ncbi:MAG: dTDP-glucose 4,6-dehydratase [Candidatus Latescibacterota bacterium]|nr:dTDP-glucose 4,6-dehydratase [Candidatus Latescibacterota bacterium]
MSRTLLITGGCGFIGSNFVRYILGKYPDVCVVNLDKLTYAGNPHNLADVVDDQRYRFVDDDIGNASIVDGLVAEADCIIHFAAESHVDRSILGGLDFAQTNVIGTAVLLEAAVRHGVERFHYISTDEVYGSIAEGEWDESYPLEPRNPYSATKASAELLVCAYHLNHDIDTVVTRASNNIGPYQYPEKRVPLYITNAIDDKPLPVYGNGMQVRDHLYVDDHCTAIDVVLHEGVSGEAYNVGGLNEATGIDVAHTILERLGKPESLLQFVKDRSGHDQRYALDSSKITALGWKPAVGIDDAMERTIRWYLDNQDWWRKIRDGEDYQVYYNRQYGERLKS